MEEKYNIFDLSNLEKRSLLFTSFSSKFWFFILGIRPFPQISVPYFSLLKLKSQLLNLTLFELKDLLLVMCPSLISKKMFSFVLPPVLGSTKNNFVNFAYNLLPYNTIILLRWNSSLLFFIVQLTKKQKQKQTNAFSILMVRKNCVYYISSQTKKNSFPCIKWKELYKL